MLVKEGELSDATVQDVIEGSRSKARAAARHRGLLARRQRS
jgi:hypothetical protein